MMSYSGQSACSAQEDVLQCCDQLYINNQIDEEQLLYLRHLVLIRDNGIASLYDQFQANRSPEELIRGLCRAAGGADTGPVEDEDEVESPDSEPSLRQDSSSSSSSSSSSDESSSSSPIRLESVVKTLKLTPVQGLLLSYLVKEHDRKVVTAFSDFRRSGDLQSLRKKLTQIAIEEDQKMRVEEKEAEEQTDEEEESRSASPSSSGEETSEGEEILVPQSPVASSRLDALLNAMNETNRWKDTVPSRFILAVFAAAQKQLIAVGHACGLCDLFQVGNELVHAAWEVFTSQGDVMDFIDTLRRIVRFAMQESGQDDGSSEDTLPRTIDPPKQKNSERTVFDVEATERDRDEAQEEVVSAKRDLLKHSLDLLTKQGLIDPEAAVLLFRQSLQDSRETDLAIEAYAANKDMMEFLKTLMTLATQALPSAAAAPQASQENPSEALYVSGALMTIADHLLEEKIIPDSLYSALVSLIKDHNPALKEAWVKYRSVIQDGIVLLTALSPSSLLLLLLRDQKCSLTDVVDVMLALSLGVPDRQSDPAPTPEPKNTRGPQRETRATILSSEDFKNIIDIYVR
jgi:hypothetical protein